MTEETNIEAVATETTTTPEAVTETSTWKDALSEDLKSHKSLEKFSGVEDIAKSYVNLESMVSKKVAEMPEEVVKQFMKVPETPDKYVIAEEAEGLISEKVLEKAIESNISQDQMKILTDTLAETHNEELTTAKLEAEKAITAEKAKLEEKFGAALPERVTQIENVFKKYGSEDLLEKTKEGGLLHNADFVEFLDKVTQDVLQVKMVESEYKERKNFTPHEAKQEINTILADEANRAAYFDKFNPDHNEIMSKVNNLKVLIK